MDRDQTAIRVYSNNQPTEPERVPIPQKVTLNYKGGSRVLKYRH